VFTEKVLPWCYLRLVLILEKRPLRITATSQSVLDEIGTDHWTQNTYFSFGLHEIALDMAPVRIFKFPILSPADTSPLQELKRAGYDASQIIGVVGKTEGSFPSSFLRGEWICWYYR